MFGDDLIRVGIIVFAHGDGFLFALEEVFVNDNLYAGEVLRVDREVHFYGAVVFIDSRGKGGVSFDAIAIGVEERLVVGLVPKVAVEGVGLSHEETVVSDDVVDGLAVFVSEDTVAISFVGGGGLYLGEFDGDSLVAFVESFFVFGEETAVVLAFAWAAIEAFVDDELAALERDSVEVDF